MTAVVKEVGVVADNDALIARAVALAPSAGVTVVTASTSPAGSVWFLFNGSTTDDRIVGGLLNVAGQMRAYTAADLDRNAIVSANIAGYINDDTANTTAIGAKIQSQTDEVNRWPAKTSGTILYVMVISTDSLVISCEYTVGGNTVQGLIHIGAPKTSAGRALVGAAYGRISAVDASTPSNTLITLDRNITNALKDQASFAGDYACAPFFQSVSGPSMPVTDFALAQRIAIKSGSLATVSGVTQFRIDATAAGKLTGAPGGTNARYRQGRGVGDIVRLGARPNFSCAFARAGGSQSANCSIVSWDNWGGQRAGMQAALGNRDIYDNLASQSPTPETGRWVTYPISVVVKENETTMLAQSDNQGLGNGGILVNVIEASFVYPQIGRLAIIQLDAQGYLRYRTIGVLNDGAGQGLTGVAIGGASTLESGLGKAICLGPGW